MSYSFEGHWLRSQVRYLKILKTDKQSNLLCWRKWKQISMGLIDADFKSQFEILEIVILYNIKKKPIF